MNKTLLLTAMLSALAALSVLPAAWATDDDNNAAVIDEHKRWLKENQVDIDSEIIYQASEQYKTAKHANDFIKNNRGEL